MSGARKAAVRFFDHKTNAWFGPGDEVPGEVAERLGENAALFEKDDRESSATTTDDLASRPEARKRPAAPQK